MPVEEFVAGWISGETFFFLLSHHTQCSAWPAGSRACSGSRRQHYELKKEE
ncbi:SLC25A45 isoform 12 [Pongo abelii]|uniref:SLC25A45 isoform 12 n=1 Tax=Pongo abelii TaxID=9601 RepID=A0A2J8TZB9_PONAB|nr:SLC25A45 isoform 12 [Pongo abelii]